MLLVALVDDGRGSLEACPHLFAQVFRHRADLAILGVELLQLVEGADDVGLLSELLSSFAELCLQFQVLLEVVFAGFVVELQQVVELLNVELVVAPQLIGLLGRHSLDVAPLLLQLLELLIGAVGLVGRGCHALYLLDDLKFLLQVLLLLSFLSLEYLGAFLLDDVHFGLEHFFKVVGAHYVVIGVAATVDVFLQLLFALGDVQLVEYRLQQVYFVFLRVFFTVSNFLHAVEHFLLRGVDFLFSLFLSCGLLCGCFLNCRLLCGCYGFFYHVLYFSCGLGGNLLFC